MAIKVKEGENIEKIIQEIPKNVIELLNGLIKYGDTSTSKHFGIVIDGEHYNAGDLIKYLQKNNLKYN